MATYHVGCNPGDNKIYAGTTNKNGTKWINSNEVTEEVLFAVRNHFLKIAEMEKTNEIGYRWETDDGYAITLQLLVQTKEEAGEIKHEREESK